jgi:transposase
MLLYLGIDWSKDKHDLAFVNAAGAQVAQRTIAHSQTGFQELASMCRQLHVTPAQCAVGIETKHNLLVDFLWSYGYSQVYVIPPSLVKGCRSRYSSSGAHTDASDAYMLADIVRTDGGRLSLWRPDQLLTQQLRATVTEVHKLTRLSVRLANQLQALLALYYPGLLALFPNLQAQTALAFLARYPTPATAAQVTPAEFAAFLASQHYAQRRRALAHLVELQQPALVAGADSVAVYAASAQRQAQVLHTVVQTKVTAQKQLATLFAQHPDQAIFASLPGTGAFLAPALLAKFGDDRTRFPTAAAVQALAGTCPVTEQSGKHRSVHFRHACDHDFRTYAQQWAIASVTATQAPFACAYYASLRRRGLDENHAYRALANRWLAIAWRLWRTQQTYDEACHLRHRAQRSQPVAAMQA